MGVVSPPPLCSLPPRGVWVFLLGGVWGFGSRVPKPPPLPTPGFPGPCSPGPKARRTGKRTPRSHGVSLGLTRSLRGLFASPLFSSRDGAFGATLWRRFAGWEFGVLLVCFSWAARELGHGVKEARSYKKGRFCMTWLLQVSFRVEALKPYCPVGQISFCIVNAWHLVNSDGVVVHLLLHVPHGKLSVSCAMCIYLQPRFSSLHFDLRRFKLSSLVLES